jgi:hypothetical protein
MNDKEIVSLKSAKRLTKDSFTIIGILAVLSYGFAALVLLYGDKILDNKIFANILICALVVLPIVIFFYFFHLVKRCYKNVFGDFGSKRTQSDIEDALLKYMEGCHKQYERILDMVSNTNLRGNGCCQRDKILWLCSEPNSFHCERAFLESRGIKIDVVTNVNKAIDLLNKGNCYIIIVNVLEHNGDNKGRDHFGVDVKNMGIKIPIFETVHYVAETKF